MNTESEQKTALLDDDDIDIDWEDVPEYNSVFAEEVYNCIDSFLNKEDITESFINNNKAKSHFNKHCLAKTDKKSKRTCVYYDFNELNEYKDYEKQIINGLNSKSLLVISSLGDCESVAKIFRKFFEGNKYLLFTPSCGFHSNNRSISILLYAFSSNVTTNYLQNTITIDIFRGQTTYTIYPIDASYLEQKLNNIIKKYCSQDLAIKITSQTSRPAEVLKDSLRQGQSSELENSERINDFIEELYELRKESIAKDGEYGLGNLVFKEFRNLGYLDNLKTERNRLKSDELSLADPDVILTNTINRSDD